MLSGLGSGFGNDNDRGTVAGGHKSAALAGDNELFDKSVNMATKQQ